MNKSSAVTILVCCHKKDYYPIADGYLPIHVGKQISAQNLEILGDNSGDHISFKNPSYCELTAHYWLWKNGEKTPYVGLNHYRRYFDFSKKPRRGQEVNFITQDGADSVLNCLPDMDFVMKDSDIILAAQRHLPYSLEHHYKFCHIPEQWDCVREVIMDKYPECISDFDMVMQSNRLSPYNMFITRWDIFNAYSEWIFDILFEVENRIQVFDSIVQRRVFGFMSERLLNVFVKWKGLKVKYLPILMIAPDIPKLKHQKLISYIFDLNARSFRFCKRFM